MIEKATQSNPENDAEKCYLIPVSHNQVAIGTVNYRKQRIDASKRIEGPDMMVTQVEVSYEAKVDNGDLILITKWVSDHHFSEIGQRDLQDVYNQINDSNDTERGL